MNGEKQKFIGGINFDELRGQRIQVYNEIVLDLNIARTNQEHVFTGTYVYASEATDVDSNVSIRFNELFRANIKLVQGRGIRCPFYRFYLTNTAQAGKSLTLVIGIESADFEIFDVGKALGITGTVVTRSMFDPTGGNTFIGGGFKVNEAAVRAIVQLWNPAASGITAYVKYAGVKAPEAAGGFMWFSYHNAKLWTANGYTSNKLIGGAAPACEVNIHKDAAVIGTPMTYLIADPSVILSQINAEPIRLLAGYGIHFTSGAVDDGVTAAFEWIEI